jgi:hypothetical protein
MATNQLSNEELIAISKEYKTIKKVINSLLQSNPELERLQLHSVRFERKQVPHSRFREIGHVDFDGSEILNDNCIQCEAPDGSIRIFCGISDCSEL